jgi:amphiphysin
MPSSNELNNRNTNQNKHSAFSSMTMMPSVTSRLKKNLARTKEKFLQGIGKTDRTSDENFDVYVQNFDHQHTQANKLAKELNKYLNCLRETQRSSKVFYETLRETYEQQWPDSPIFYEQIQQMEVKWIEYINTLNNDVQLPLISYMNEFPELKKKIEKRQNRLLDYDNARHTLEGVQSKTLKRQQQQQQQQQPKDMNQSVSNSISSSSSNTNNSSPTSTDQLTKLTKLKIDLEDKQSIYEEINQTLCMTLPVLYENRIKFYASLFQSFFHTETIFHSDCVEIKSKLDEVCENLSTKTSFQHQQQTTVSNKQNKNKQGKQVRSEFIPEQGEDNGINERYCHQQQDSFVQDEPCHSSSEDISGEEPPVKPISSPSTKSDEQQYVDADDKEEHEEIQVSKSAKSNSFGSQIINRPNPFKTSADRKEDNYLYRVRATYPYEAKETDELSFVKDDLIQVIEGTESEREELDDGWLIGIHETSKRRGLFPENFTKKAT